MNTPHWPAAQVQLAPTDSAWVVILKVRQAMKATGAPAHLVGEATDAILLAGNEGAHAVATRWVYDTNAQLEELL